MDREGTGSPEGPCIKWKEKWPVKMIGNILTNGKYTGIPDYGETKFADFPSHIRTSHDPFEVHWSYNHHILLIHGHHFKRVWKLQAKRSNIEVEVRGNKISNSTHYDSKKPVNKTTKTSESQHYMAYEPTALLEKQVYVRETGIYIDLELRTRLMGQFYFVNVQDLESYTYWSPVVRHAEYSINASVLQTTNISLRVYAKKD